MEEKEDSDFWQRCMECRWTQIRRKWKQVLGEKTVEWVGNGS